ncbi:MAG: MFS transporter [Anaerolinea sp.]|nr:MFS transporter [Anaerolinea sp.]
MVGTLRLRGISRPVWLLSLVSLLADLSGEMVYPLIPLFLTGTLGAPAAAVGVVEGVAEGTANVTRLVSGRWADRAGVRKPFVVAGYALGALGKLLVGLSVVWPFALVGRSVDRFGKGIRGAPRDAMLADFATSEDRGRVFGFHRAMDTLGAVAGPLVGLAFLQSGAALRIVILLAVIPGILSVLAMRLVPESRLAVKHTAAAAPGHSPAHLPTAFYLLLGATTVFMIGNSSDAFLILRSKDLGLTTTLVVLAYVAYNAVYALLSLPAGIVSDRIPRVWVLLAGYLLFAGVYLGFAATDSSALVWPLFLVYGGYIALTDGVSKALVADLVPAASRSSANGLFQGFSGLAVLVASVTAGLLWDNVSERAPFYLGAGCASLAAVAILVLLWTGTFNAPREA